VAKEAKARLVFWLAVAGAALAIPVVTLATCQLRGYLPSEGESARGPDIDRQVASVVGGALIGAAVAAVLGTVAVIAHRRSKRDGPPGRSTHC
jgi:hypothetical protein